MKLRLRRDGYRVGRGLVLAACAALSLLAQPGTGLAETPFVGLEVKGLNKEVAEALGLDMIDGAIVTDVALGGAGALAGLLRGDVFLEYDGKPVTTFYGLVDWILAGEIGQSVPVTVLRQGEKKHLTLVLTDKPGPWRDQKKAVAAVPELGLTLATITQKVREGFNLRWASRGVLVTLTDVVKSQGLGLSRGDVIHQINQRDVWEPDQILKAYGEAKQQGRKHLLALIERPTGFVLAFLPVR